ncbi:MAG TPA: guanylate kinase, partial [bacterium]|nr:guanylate kinase [bacterium]
LEKRLRGRKTETEEVIATRLKNAEEEMKYKDKYEYCIINDDLEQAIAELKTIIKKYR